jgi:hypothetical protein
MPRPSALLAILLALSVALSACSKDSGGSDGSGSTDSPTGSADVSGTATPAEPAEDAEVAATVMVGEHRHRPACRLLTPTDAIELLRLTDEGDFEQDGLTTSVPVEGAPGGRADGDPLARTSCRYQLGDADNTTVRLDVEEYADERSARSRWATIRRFGERRLPPGLIDGPSSFDELDAALRAILDDAQESIGGVRVPGVDERILWRTGSTEFVATAGNLFLTFDRAENFGFTPTLTERDAALAERVLVRAIDHAADAETPTTPVPPLFAQDADWPPFLDPCSLLDEEVAQALLGRRPERVRTSSVDLGPDVNLGGDSAAGRSTENRCEREVEGRNGTAELLVQYVAPPDTAEEVLDSYLGNLAFGDTTPSRRQVDQIRASMVPGGLADVDASYVFVVGGQRSSYWSYLLLDRYLLELTGALPRGKYGSRSVDTSALRDAGELLVANLAATVADGSTG